ncbi:POK18 protein, partial [Pandion haliaetus]|nr:POK18 protein [Pandion haliaetus]
QHWTNAFAVMGAPTRINTDNGPAYTLVSVRAFLNTWGIEHLTGISHNPAGQAIIERAHGT